MYDPIVGRWQIAEAMTMLRSRVGVVVMNNKMYAIGGYNGHERLSTVEVFDPVRKCWSKVASMNCKRRLVIMPNISHKHRIFCVIDKLWLSTGLHLSEV